MSLCKPPNALSLLQEATLNPMRLSLPTPRLCCLALNLVGGFVLSVTAVTQSRMSFKPNISLTTSFKLGETLPRTLNYFWKQNDLCPTEDLGGWLPPTMLPIFVVLSYGLRGKPQSQCHHLLHTWLLVLLIPLLTLSTLPSGLDCVECFPFLLPGEDPDFLLGMSFHSGTTIFVESEVCFPLVLCHCFLKILLSCKSSPLSLIFNDHSALLLLPLFHL